MFFFEVNFQIDRRNETLLALGTREILLWLFRMLPCVLGHGGQVLALKSADSANKFFAIGDGLSRFIGLHNGLPAQRGHLL